MRLLSIGLAILLALATAGRADVQGVGTVEFVGIGGTLARLWLPPNFQDRPSPHAVVVVGDTSTPDARGDRYMERLNASGIAALELILPDDGGVSDQGRDAAWEMLADAAAILTGDQRLDPNRIGLLAFGLGARSVFAAAWGIAMGDGRWGAVALLYPGCAARAAELRDLGRSPAVGQAPVLLLHGSDDAANPPAACAGFAEELQRSRPVRRVEYRGAGYAWDRPSYGDVGSEMLPRPDGPGRIRCRPWPALAEVSSARVASFFTLTLAAP